MPHMFPIPALACGMCADTAITGLMPFLVYWLFLALIAAWVIGAPCTMGAVVAPAFFVLVFWLFLIRDNIRKPNMIWRRTHQILAIILLSCIPISYILPKPYAEYRKLMNRPRQYYPQPPENDSLKGEGENIQ